MSIRSEYISMVEHLTSTGNWSLTKTLSELSLPARVDWLIDAVVNACTCPTSYLPYLPTEDDLKEADLQADRFTSLLLRAVNDVFMLEHTCVFRFENGTHGDRYFKDNTHREREISATVADKRAAEVAQMVYNRLPMKVEVRDYGNHSESGKIAKTCYPVTRQALFDAIIGRWARTSDQTEADGLFSFIVKAAEQAANGHHSDYLKIIIETLRKHDGTCNIGRLEHAIAALKPLYKSGDNHQYQTHGQLLDVLEVAWVRALPSSQTQTTATVQRLAKLHSVIGEPTDAFWAALMTEAKAIQEFSVLIESLVKLLNGYSSSWKVESADHKTNKVTIGMTVGRDNYQFSEQRAKEDIFSAAEMVKTWDQGNKLASVTLIIRREDYNDKLRFEEKFTVS